MKTQDILIAHPQTNEQVSALKAFMNALNIEFEVANVDSYNPTFVKKIIDSKKQISEGKYTDVARKDIKSFIDSL